MMTEIHLTATLVGMHFRPPAKAVLAHLPAEAQLDLTPEPENPHDEFAVKVLVEPETVPQDEYTALREDLAASGFDLDDLLEGPSFQLGYIGSKPGKRGPLLGVTYAPELQPQLLSAEDYKAKLGFDQEGDPLVLITIITSESP